MKEPMTVADLMARLEKMEPSAVVMVECDDNYYSGPLTPEQLRDGEALRIGPFDYETPGEDAYGRSVPRETKTWPGGWTTAEERGDDERGEILDRRPCIVILAE